MLTRLEVRQNQQRIYDIVLSQSLEHLREEMSVLGYKTRKLCIVSDSQVWPLHGLALREAFSDVCSQVEFFVFPAGEESKTLDTVQQLYTFLIEKHFDRKDALVALGGGVVGDLTGYTAATYLRGIDFIQIPTSLLAMVDSSIGGKTGVDFQQYKNMVGAFKMPRLVYMNLSYLDTLPDEQYFNGMAEVMKSGLIQDVEFYSFLLSSLDELLTREMSCVEQMVLGCCRIKRQVVEEDPFEHGIRAYLNFGHTIGHAIEKRMNFQLLHGQCVALGVVCAAYLSYKRGYLQKEEFLEIRDVLVAYGLPVTLSSDMFVSAEEIIALTKSDKKMDAGNIRFVLLREVGEAMVTMDVTEAEMKQAIEETILKPAGEDVHVSMDDQIIRMSEILADNEASDSDCSKVETTAEDGK